MASQKRGLEEPAAVCEVLLTREGVEDVENEVRGRHVCPLDRCVVDVLTRPCVLQGP